MARQCPGAGNRSGAGRGPCRRRRHRAFRSSRPDLRSRGFAPGKPLPGHEAKRLLAALERTAGNVREAAKLLGISRGGFYVKLKKLGLNPDEYR
ncbi:MAG: helix-turn-helix domain-containing protein [Bilophila wadsworthia]